MDDEISKKLSYLNKSDKEIGELYRKLAASCGLSESAFWILYVISVDGEGCTQNEICKSWFYSSQTINSALKKLEGGGYIQLNPVAGNRKSKRVMLTDNGRKLRDKIIRPILIAERTAFEYLDEQERRSLLELSLKRANLLRVELEKIMPEV